MSTLAAITAPWKNKHEILADAILAVDGLAADAVATVFNEVTRRYPNFPWNENWYGQIVSECMHLRHEQSLTGEPATVSTTASFSENLVRNADIERARDFVNHIGDGSIEKARQALEFIQGFGHLERVGPALETWDALLAAVGGDEAIATRALEVLVRHMTNESWPRIADRLEHAEAA